MFNRRLALFFTVAALSLKAAPFTFNSSASLPPVGLASSETLQVNVANTAVSTVIPAPSCTGTITFYNAGGTAIGNPTAFTVGSRQLFSATLPYASAGATTARTVVRAEITLTSTVTGAAPPPCSLSSSLETFDTATGATHTLAAGAPVTSGVVGGIVSTLPFPVTGRP